MAYNPKSDKPFAAGDPGLVPAQETPDGSFLKDDGTWDSPIGTTDEKTGVSVDDTTPGYLDDKVSVGSGLKKTITSPAGDEGLEVAVDTSGVATEYMNGTGAFSTPPDTNTTYPVFDGANDGLVPDPVTPAGNFLKDDGTWAAASGGSSSGTYDIEDTISDSTGILLKGAGNPFLHNYHNPDGGGAIPQGGNVFLGEDVGNFTVGSTASNAVHGSDNIGIGHSTLNALTIGYENIAIGRECMPFATSATYNIAIGLNAMYDNTTGDQNVAIGALNLQNLTDANGNIAIGHNSSTSITTGDNNISIGRYSLTSAVSGGYNISLGYQSMQDGVGSYNVAIGNEALKSSNSGNYTIAIGSTAANLTVAGALVTSATYGVFIGQDSRPLTATSTNEIVIGKSSHGNGDNTTTIGSSATTDCYIEGTLHAQTFDTTDDGLVPSPGASTGLFLKDDGTWAAAGGASSGSYDLEDTTSSTTGILLKGAGNPFLHNFHHPNNGTVTPDGNNIFLGEDAGNFTVGSTATLVTQGSNNVGVGSNSLSGVTAGYENVAIGSDALAVATSGNKNVAIGHGAMSTHGNNLSCTAVGHGALLNADGSGKNTAVGLSALGSVTWGQSNVAVGADCMNSLGWGYNNVAVGLEALSSVVSGNNNIGIGSYSQVLGTGSDNVGVGMYSLRYNSGNENVAVGNWAGARAGSGTDNASFGHYSGTNTIAGSMITCNQSTFLGAMAESGDVSRSTTNEISIGYMCAGNGANTTTIGNSSTTDTYIEGELHADIPAFTDTENGSVPAPTTATGLFLKDDGTWAAAGGASSGTYDIEDTISDSTGILLKGAANPFLHNFHHPTGDTVAPEGNNVFLGEGAGNFTMGSTATGTFVASNNIGIGSGALASNMTGGSNVGIGTSALSSLAIGGGNVAIGKSAHSDYDGYSNVAVGFEAMKLCGGQANVAFGYQSLYGGSALSISQGYNVAIGDHAGHYSTTDTTVTAPQSCILIGAGTRPLSITPSNEIVIGDSADGNGSNTTTIGNSSTTDTYIEGELHADIPTFTATVNGAVPFPTTATGKFLKDDATWADAGADPMVVDATYYISPTGNDTTGDGLTVGTPWATPGKALDVIKESNVSGNVTVNVATGTYTGLTDRLIFERMSKVHVTFVASADSYWGFDSTGWTTDYHLEDQLSVVRVTGSTVSFNNIRIIPVAGISTAGVVVQSGARCNFFSCEIRGYGGEALVASQNSYVYGWSELKITGGDVLIEKHSTVYLYASDYTERSTNWTINDHSSLIIESYAFLTTGNIALNDHSRIYSYGRNTAEATSNGERFKTGVITAKYCSMVYLFEFPTVAHVAANGFMSGEVEKVTCYYSSEAYVYGFRLNSGLNSPVWCQYHSSMHVWSCILETAGDGCACYDGSWARLQTILFLGNNIGIIASRSCDVYASGLTFSGVTINYSPTANTTGNTNSFIGA